MPSGQLATKIVIDAKSIHVPPANVSDESLVEQVKQGDVNAYGRIIRRYNQRLYRVARCIVKNDADALDVVQEAHIKAYTKINEFRGESRFASWLAVIARNEALMYLRKTSKEVTMSENDADIIDISRALGTQYNSSLGPESLFEKKNYGR